jgi:hypothetical protein
VAYVNFPVFAAFANHGSPAYRLLVRKLLDRLLPDPLLRVEAPTGTEATVTRQRRDGDGDRQRDAEGRGEAGRGEAGRGEAGRGEAGRHRTIVHLLHYSPERRTKTMDLVEDVVPLHDVPLSLRLGKAPAKVYVAPGRAPLFCEYAAGRARVVVPEVRGHAMVVFE